MTIKMTTEEAGEIVIIEAECRNFRIKIRVVVFSFLPMSLCQLCYS